LHLGARVHCESFVVAARSESVNSSRPYIYRHSFYFVTQIPHVYADNSQEHQPSHRRHNSPKPISRRDNTAVNPTFLFLQPALASAIGRLPPEPTADLNGFEAADRNYQERQDDACRVEDPLN